MQLFDLAHAQKRRRYAAALQHPCQRNPGRRFVVVGSNAAHHVDDLPDLTQAMGVTPSSIYTTFGDKKDLFMAAVGRYLSGPVTSESIIEGAATGYAAAEGLLSASEIGFTGNDTPPGWLLASSAISCSAMARDVQVALADIRHKIEAKLRGKIAASIKLGHLPPETDAAGLAAHTMALIQGMSTLARDGATRHNLLRIAKMGMQCWPVREHGEDGH